MSKEMELAIKAAKNAGKIIMKHYSKIDKLHYKSARDFATQADFDAEKSIISAIKKVFPAHAILAEESGESGSSDSKWIIDPLDGTHNFVVEVPLFGVGIALERKGQVVLSVIYLPCSKELYSAEKGKGAFLNGKRIFVSPRKENFMVTFGGFWGISDPFVRKRFDKLAEKFHDDFRIPGSAVVQLAWLASGKADGSLMLNEKPWDIAPALIVEEAGGVVTGINGEKWTPYLTHYVAATKMLHREILNLARD
ncbi:MAG: inositol monophosphatase [Candidatus Aenigmarchaeota archaeon]|nr:inositol monophosphatase [Candidatus Aenigmarchaeota archaeon]